MLAALAVTPLMPSLPCTAESLTYVESATGLKFADVKAGSGPAVVEPNSRVTCHIIGRLVGKQGWVFENSQKVDDEPYRLQMGTGQMISGLEEGLRGMREGGMRRLLIPSRLGYLNRELEPIPREFGARQRLYTTVLNDNRKRQEAEALGSDLAGVVLIDVLLVTVRAAASSGDI